MRNVLNELPVFALSIWSGVAAGFLVSLLRLPRELYSRSLKGRRAKAVPLILFGLADVIAACSACAVFCAAMIFANGGELRLYAVCGFLAGAAVPYEAVKLLLSK